MTDHTQRLTRLDEQAMVLVDDLQEFLAGRPVDVIVDALATAAARAVAREAMLTESEIVRETHGAREFVQEALAEIVGPTRHDRLCFAFYALQVAVFSSAVLNAGDAR